MSFVLLSGAIVGLSEYMFMLKETASLSKFNQSQTFLTSTVFDAIETELTFSIITTSFNLFNVTNEDFLELSRIFVERNDVQVIFYSPLITENTRDEFENDISQLYGRDIQIYHRVDGEQVVYPENSNATYWPIYYRYPLSNRPLQEDWGFDLSSSRFMKNSITRMLQNQLVQMSDPVVFGTGELGVLILQQIHANDNYEPTGMIARAVTTSSIFKPSELFAFMNLYPKADIEIVMTRYGDDTIHVVFDNNDDAIRTSRSNLDQCFSLNIPDKFTTFHQCIYRNHTPVRELSYILICVFGVITSALLSCMLFGSQFVVKSSLESKLKSRFLADMSHEIRTPMNGIMGSIDLLQQKRLDPASQEYVSIMNSCSKTLLTIVDDILDVSKIEAGMMTLKNEDFDLKEAVESALFATWLGYTQDPSLRKNISLTLDISNCACRSHMTGDSTKIKQILSNLTSNALKFTDIGGVNVVIDVIEGKSRDTICIMGKVQDTGIGMSSAKIRQIFKPFTQVHVKRDVGGTGLGLVITKKFVHMMGGVIECESKPNSGTTFSFYVFTHGRISRETGRHVKNFQNNVVCPLEETSVTNVTNNDEDEDEEVGSVKPKILVVDDNAINRKIISRMVESFGYGVVTANDGKEAVDICHSTPFSAILMDYVMPVMNGIESTKTIRKGIGINKETAIIFLTATTTSSTVDECRRAGATEILLKPVSKQVLGSCLSNILDI